MSITFPTALARRQINEIRLAIGRPVIFNTVYYTECTQSGCYLNPITGNSTNPFCPVCGGDYYIESYSGITISGHITWYPSDKLQWYPGGQHFDGDVRIQIEHTVENLATLDLTDHVIVDGKVVEIKKTTLRGFQELNRIILECKEKEKEV